MIATATNNNTNSLHEWFLLSWKDLESVQGRKKEIARSMWDLLSVFIVGARTKEAVVRGPKETAKEGKNLDAEQSAGQNRGSGPVVCGCFCPRGGAAQGSVARLAERSPAVPSWAFRPCAGPLGGGERYAERGRRCGVRSRQRRLELSRCFRPGRCP